MKKIICASVLLTILQFPLSAQNQVTSGVVANGGGTAENDSHSIVGTIGQPVTGFSSNSSNAAQHGFWAQVIDVVTHIEKTEDTTLPEEFRLRQNYPNPFNPTTTIEFALPQQSEVTLKIYDVLGRVVATLIDEIKPAGEYKVTFEGSALPTGIYIYQLTTDSGFNESRKLTLLK